MRPESTTVIVPARPKDCARLTDIARLSKAYWGYPTEWLAEWHDLLAIKPGDLDGADVFMAVAGQTIVGFYALRFYEDALELDHLWVIPAAVGRGVGRMLLRHAVERAARLGADRIIIESDPHAAGFYERMGGSRVGVRRGRVAGTPRILPVLELSVTASQTRDAATRHP